MPESFVPSKAPEHRAWSRTLADEVIRSALPGGAEVPRVRREELLRGVPSDEPAVFAARLMVAVRGDSEEAVERMLGAGRGPYRGAPSGATMALDAAVAEARILLGDAAGALGHANELRERALYTGDALWNARSAGLLAAASALNGMIGRAEAALIAGEAVSRRSGWQAEDADPFGLLAETVIGIVTSDKERLARTIARIDDATTRRPSLRALRDLARAVHLLDTGEDHRAMALTVRISQALSASGVPRIARQAAVQMQAQIFLRRGEPLTALRALDGIDLTPGHLPCASTTRALALLQLGDHRRVLAETRDCVRRRRTHNLLVLPTTLLVRAVAQLRLGRHEAALHSAGDAFGLAAASTRAGRLALIPRGDLADLLDLVTESAPEFGTEVAELRRLAGPVPATEVSSAPRLFGQLSARERAVADHLDDAQPLAGIAGALNLSIHTVKTHTKAIYRKLGVASREEAIDLLARIGYFES
ncbi:helix-turn-helix transcriptional regulator [Microbacterium sp.]|uniref:helix-turn-helix transcriptional regulator n=1 Tax=Microbacterium sp. TaxID=51671 RepID=UPI0033410CF9